MKKLTGTIALLVVFIVLFALYYFQGKSNNQKKEDVYPKFSIEKEKVDKILLENSEKNISLEKEGAIWKVNGFRADQEKIQKILDTFSDIKIIEFVSDNKDKQDIFKISDEEAKKISFNGSKKIVVGKTSRSGGTYIRNENSDKTYLAEDPMISYSFDLSEDFRDKKIVSIKEEKIKKIERELNGEKIVFAKNQEGKWILEGNEEKTDSEKIDSFLKDLLNLETEGFEQRDSEKDYGFESANLLIRIKTDNAEKVLRFVPWKESEDNPMYNIGLEGDRKTVYSAKTEKVEKFKKPTEDFLTKEEDAESETATEEESS